MSRAKKVHWPAYEQEPERWGIGFWCPGCDEPHMVNDGWVITGTLDLPTIQPSIRVTGVMGWDDPRPSVCHSFVTAGRIQFLQDCTHALKGQLVDLPEWPYP